MWTDKKNNTIPNLFGWFFVVSACVCIIATPVFAAKLTNPISAGTVPEVIGLILRGLLGLAGIAALIMFVWGGVQMILSQGESKKYENGITTLRWASIGILMVFGSYAIVNYLLTTILGSV